MGEWFQANITGPVLTGLLAAVLVPMAVAWFRYRRTLTEIGEGLSKSEATFRADLIAQVSLLRDRYEDVQKSLLECQRQHAEAEIEIARLRAKIDALKG